jgi:hypothetical protein
MGKTGNYLFKGGTMKAFFDKFDAWPSDQFGTTTFAPLTYIEQATGACITFLALVGVLAIVAGIAWVFVKALERRERAVK